MDERFRSVGSFNPVFNDSPIAICSNDYPSFGIDTNDSYNNNDNCIFLRGESREDDLQVCVKRFMTNEQRDKYYNDVLVSLKKWSNEWPGFNEERTSTDPDKNYTFEL